MSYNLKNIPKQQQEFGLIPESTYDILAVEVKKGMTMTSKKEKLSIRWKILSPTSVGGERTKNRQFFDDILLQPSMYWRLENALNAVESPLVNTDIDSIEEIMRAFRNKVITAGIIISEFNKKERNVIQSFSVCETQYAESAPEMITTPTVSEETDSGEDFPF